MADAHDDAAGTSDPRLAILDDPDAPPTEDELREARALAEALETSTAPHDDALFLKSLVHAHAPERAALDPAVHERIVAGAIARAPRRRSGARVVRLVFGGGLAAAVAIAASVLFFLGSPRESAPPSLAQSRSTQELFREPFGGQEASARIDRIAMARGGDLRENRFARWGVR